MLNTALARVVTRAFKEQHDIVLPTVIVEEMEQVEPLDIFVLNMPDRKLIAAFNGANPFDKGGASLF